MIPDKGRAAMRRRPMLFWAAPMRIRPKDYRVRPGADVDLKEWPTRVAPAYATNEEYQKLLRKHVEALSAQQELLYASNRHAILLIFQAMDAAGKDGAIAHVMSG